MINTKLKNCEDILNYLSYIERTYDELEDEVSKMKFTFFSPSSRKRKAKIKRRMVNIEETLEEYSDFFKESTTFPRRDLAMFFIQYFAALYNKKYIAETNIRNKSEGRYPVSCDLIASERDFKILDQKFNFKKKVNLEKAIDMCQDTCIVFGGPDPYTLLAGTNIPENIDDFPELADAIKLLIDLKLSDPNMSDRQRLAFALKILISRIAKERMAVKPTSGVAKEAPKVIKQSQRPQSSPKVTDVAKQVPTLSYPTYTKPEDIKPTQQPHQEPTRKVLTKSLMGSYMKKN